MTGRFYQDTHFNLTILNGLPIEQLKICVNPDDENICLVYLKAEGQPIFHFFLDVGIAFCECWNEYEVDEDDDDYLLMTLRRFGNSKANTLALFLPKK